MYSLEYKQLYIVKEPMRKNCTTQSYCWKQAAVCAERKPLEEILKKKPDKENWRISGYEGGSDNEID